LGPIWSTSLSAPVTLITSTWIVETSLIPANWPAAVLKVTSMS